MSELEDIESDASESLNIFDEPSDYYAKEKPASFQTHRFLDGREVELRLVGQSPLWVRLSSEHFLLSPQPVPC